jgi:ribonuclease E
MPNTARGGGISRKITNAADRKKLKEIAGEMDVPEGAGLIIRTAGANRTKAEIKRDYEYLPRLWEQIRELTLKSIAPAPIYEEGNLIKRSIRDLYNARDRRGAGRGRGRLPRGQGLHEDDHAVPRQEREALYRPDAAVRALSGRKLSAAMFNPTVQLKSGGYIVIGVTEALVAIDINSGRATQGRLDRGDRAQDQPRSRRGDRPPAAPARPGRADRHRLHRHGGAQEQRRRREAPEGR